MATALHMALATQHSCTMREPCWHKPTRRGREGWTDPLVTLRSTAGELGAVTREAGSNRVVPGTTYAVLVVIMLHVATSRVPSVASFRAQPTSLETCTPIRIDNENRVLRALAANTAGEATCATVGTDDISWPKAAPELHLHFSPPVQTLARKER